MERETQISMTVDDHEAPADSDGESSSESGCRQFRDFTRNGMVKMELGDSEYGVVEKRFKDGMGVLAREVNVLAVHKNPYSSITGQARLEAFRLFSQAVATKRGGDANIKHAWYGAARDEILGIVTHGFGRCGDFEQGFSHGIGVYLSPANDPIDCAIRAKEDEYGVRHVLLCRVILGNTEMITAGSRQFQPSSTNFDSGIDNPLSPTKYTIWSAYMNSHIFPNFIISFTAPSLTRNPIFSLSVFLHQLDLFIPALSRCSQFYAGSGTSSLPNSSRMNFSVLINVLSRILNPSQMASVLNSYNDFRENKIGRPHLITILRSLVGDQLLISAIRFCRYQRV